VSTRPDRPIKILAIMEAASVTGPAKNLLNFCAWTKSAEAAALGFDLSIEIATYCRGGEKSTDNRFISTASAMGFQTHIIEERYRYDSAVIPQLIQLADRVRPDLLQTHNVKSHFLMKRSGLPRRIPWLAFQHGYTATNLKMSAYNQLDRWSLRSARLVVTVCQAFVARLRTYGVAAERIRVLHNSVVPFPPVAAAEESALRQELSLSESEPCILTIGRFSIEKGHADFIEALARLHAEAPQEAWRALIVGDGPEEARLRQSIDARGLKDRIVFAGFRSGVAAFYAGACMFVLPSHSEGSPNVLLEAMASRVPVVATTAGGVPEIVTHEETALLTPVRNPALLAKEMGRMLRDRELAARLTEAAYRRALDEFSPDRYRRNLLEIYYEALGRPLPEPAASVSRRQRL
jgi:glycosyltransferase involved in cell wall biosynthesis